MGKEKPLVSIVTPSYNQGRFIEETIKSVLAQDYPNIEYIVVDGGSTDDTVEILKKYSGRIKWVSEKDKGQSDAIEKGFKMSKGEILAWLNSDDTYLEGAVGKAAERLISSGAGMAYGRVYYIDREGKVIGEATTGAYDFNRLATTSLICQPSVFFKRNAFYGAGGIDKTLHYTMDYDLWIRMAGNYGVEYMPEFFSTYRLHDVSKTVSDAHALEFAEEYLKTVMKYHGRAPLNRVWACCYLRLLSRLSSNLLRFKPVVIFFALLYTIEEYIKLNKGVRFADLRLITPSNIKRMMSGEDGRPRL